MSSNQVQEQWKLAVSTTLFQGVLQGIPRNYNNQEWALPRLDKAFVEFNKSNLRFRPSHNHKFQWMKMKRIRIQVVDKKRRTNPDAILNTIFIHGKICRLLESKLMSMTFVCYIEIMEESIQKCKVHNFYQSIHEVYFDAESMTTEQLNRNIMLKSNNLYSLF